MPSTTRIYKHPWKEKLTEIQDRLITTCQTWFVSCLISKGDFYQFIHLWDRLIVYSRLVPQNIWATRGEYQSNIEHFTTGTLLSTTWGSILWGFAICWFEFWECLVWEWWLRDVRVMIPRCESDGLVFDAEKGVVRPGRAKPWLKRAPLGPHPLFPKITNSLLSPRIIHGWLDVKQCIWVNLAVKASVPNTEVLKFLWMRPHFFLQCFFEVCKTAKRIWNTC